MNTLDQWAKYALADCTCGLDSCPKNSPPNSIIIALINGWRKKDEALQLCYEKSFGDGAEEPELNARAEMICITAAKALALTKELK